MAIHFFLYSKGALSCLFLMTIQKNLKYFPGKWVKTFLVLSPLLRHARIFLRWRRVACLCQAPLSLHIRSIPKKLPAPSASVAIHTTLFSAHLSK